MGPGTGAGAVYVTVALPFAPVTMDLAESEPKSTNVLFARISARMGTFALGWPFASRASTVICDCDAPSNDSVSGFAVIASDNPRLDGPCSIGVGVFDTVHDATANAAVAT